MQFIRINGHRSITYTFVKEGWPGIYSPETFLCGLMLHGKLHLLDPLCHCYTTTVDLSSFIVWAPWTPFRKHRNRKLTDRGNMFYHGLDGEVELKVQTCAICQQCRLPGPTRNGLVSLRLTLTFSHFWGRFSSKW